MDSHELTRERVRQEVPDSQPGFYRLGYVINGRFYTSYVGRSDNCLQTRLQVHAQLDWFTHFVPRPTPDEEEAYHLECLFYHLEQKHTANQRHPARPDHTDLHCTYCEYEQQLVAIENEHGTIYTNVN